MVLFFISDIILLGHETMSGSTIIHGEPAVFKKTRSLKATMEFSSKRTEMNLYLIFYLKIYIVFKKDQKWYSILKDTNLHPHLSLCT